MTADHSYSPWAEAGGVGSPSCRATAGPRQAYAVHPDSEAGKMIERLYGAPGANGGHCQRVSAGCVAGEATRETPGKTDVAMVLRETLISRNACDANLEPANVVDGLFAVARALMAVAEAIEGARRER